MSRIGLRHWLASAFPMAAVADMAVGAAPTRSRYQNFVLSLASANHPGAVHGRPTSHPTWGHDKAPAANLWVDQRCPGKTGQRPACGVRRH